MPPTTRPWRLLSRRADLHAESSPEWGVLRTPSIDPALEACRALLETYGALGSPLHGFFVEDSFDESGTLANIDQALAVVEPRLAAVNGQHSLKLGPRTAGSACEVVYLIAHDLRRAIADRTSKPGADDLGEEHGGGPSVSVTYPSIGTVPVETLREAYRLLPDELSVAEPTDRGNASNTASEPAEAPIGQLCLALLIYRVSEENETSPRTTKVTASNARELLRSRRDIHEFAKEHRVLLTEDAVKKMNLRADGLLAGKPGTAMRSLTQKGEAWLAAGLGDCGAGHLMN